MQALSIKIQYRNSDIESQTPEFFGGAKLRNRGTFTGLRSGDE
jgi:hypothetical protein